MMTIAKFYIGREVRTGTCASRGVMSTHVPVHVHAPGRGGGVVVFAHVPKMCMFQVGGEWVDNFKCSICALWGVGGGCNFHMSRMCSVWGMGSSLCYIASICAYCAAV